MEVTIGLWIAFGSGLAWSGLDICRKALSSRFGALTIACGLSLGLALLFGLATMVAPVRMDLAAYLVPGLISTLLSIAIQILILESVRRADLSRTIPMLSVTPVATSLFGVVLLDEWPSSLEWIGIGLVFLGAVALGLSRKERPGTTGGSRFGMDSGVVLMLLAALCISAAAPFDKLAIRASTTPLHGFIQSLGGAIALVSILAARREGGKLVGAFRGSPWMTGAVLFVFGGIGLQFLAYRTAMVGEVETIKRVVGMVVSLVAGAVVFGERITLRKLLAVGAMGAGIALVLLGATS